MNASNGFFSHNVVEILSTDLSTIACCSLKHFLQFSGVHGFAELLSNSFDIVKVDASSFVIVEQGENLVNTSLEYKLVFTLDSLSPSLEVIASKNYSKSISRPSASKSAIMLNIVGFLASNPKLCIADFSSLRHMLYTWGRFFRRLQYRKDWRLL